MISTTWAISAPTTLPTGLELSVSFPESFSPIIPMASPGDSEPGSLTLIIPVAALSGDILWKVAADAVGPFHIHADLLASGVIQASADLTIAEDGFFLIDADGGSGTSFGGEVKVTFPSTAIQEPLEVRVQIPPTDALPPYTLGGRLMEITAQGQLSDGPVDQFLAPVTIEVAYDEQNVRGHEASLKLYYFDETLQDWLPLPSVVDTGNNILTGYTDHFSLMDWQAQNWEAARLPTVDGFQVSTFTGAATYSYDIWTPPGPAGLQPELTLNYHSQTVDGSASRGQASWVGMGWSLDTGHIRRNMNGTPTDYDDDTFSLVVAGVGGLLLPISESDGDGNANTEDYRLAEDNFWRIRRYTSEGDVWGYTGDRSYWLVEDQQGNRYYFGAGDDGYGYPEGHGWYPAYTGGCSAPFMQTWQWSLTSQENIFGRAITYSYAKENDRKWHPACHGSYDADANVAIYPHTIYYPHGRYRVRFVRQEGRSDHVGSWLGNNETILFRRSRLAEILLEHDHDGNQTFDRVKKYAFTYDDGAIFPGVTWPADGQTPTLIRVQEYGPEDRDILPATTFAYDDSMHLIVGENGYGGEVEFAYDATPFYELDGHESEYCSPYWNPGGGAGHVDNVAVCSHFGVYKKYFQPGGTYKITAEVEAGHTATIGIDDGTQIIYADPVTAPTNPPAYTSFDVYITLSAQASQARAVIDCDCTIRSIRQTPLVTRYRTTSKTRRDPDPQYGTSAETTYSYDEPATNDADHSDFVGACTDDQLHNPGCSEFRGHAMVQELGPVGSDGHRRQTTTWFHQDDERKGRPSVSVVGEHRYTESFNESSDWNAYSGEWNDDGGASIERVNGDYALKNHQPGAAWAYVERAGSTLVDGQAILVQFRLGGTAGQTESVVALQSGSKRWGVYFRDGSLVFQHNDGSGFQEEASSLSVSFGTWYQLLMVIDDDDMFTYVWARDEPSQADAFYCSDDPECNQSGLDDLNWHFKQFANEGTTWIDGYSELRVLTMGRSYYQVDQGTEVPNPLSVGDFQDLDIVWTAVDRQVDYVFEGAGQWVSSQTDYAYQKGNQGGEQYGHVTQSTDAKWTGSAWDEYRATVTKYYPYVSASKYLVGLPGYIQTYACPSATCGLTQGDTLAKTVFRYDNNPSDATPPSTGKLTAQRTLLRYVNGTQPRYRDEVYGYDAWGNRDEATSYTGEGTAGSLASIGPRLTITDHEDTYHTYATSVDPPEIGPTAYTYDYALGVVLTETGPNGAATTVEAHYDAFGRLEKLVRPEDSEAQPTVEIDYEDWYPQSLGDPFMVAIHQRITSGASATFTQRKFYNGLGQLIQAQTAGAQLDSGARDVVVDYAYDGYGNPVQTTVPYGIQPWDMAGTPFDGQQLSQPSHRTTYDVLGRPRVQTATDDSTTSYSYWLLAAEVEDALGRVTTTSFDIWGRTVKVDPPIGPEIAYIYDEADRLEEVKKQVNGTPVATTVMSYDLGGRKKTLDDPDMGDWTYSYDALNLTSQVDARNCTTTFDYDALNRLTGKSYSGAACAATAAVTYSYDDYNAGSGQYGRGYRTGMSDDVSGSTTWKYDTRGRVWEARQVIPAVGEYVTRWGYNAADAIAWMKYPGGNQGEIGEQVTYTYHPQQAVDSVAGADTYVQSTDYNAPGQVVERRLGSPEAVRQTYSYYGWGWTGQSIGGGQKWLESLQAGPPGDLDEFQDLSYQYDRVGNVKEIDDWIAASPQTQTFDYDALDRLTHAEAAGGGQGTYSQNYSYDPEGRLETKDQVDYYYNAAPFHAVSGLENGFSYSYDANGNMTGRELGAAAYTLEYDVEDRLAGVTGDATASYVYDGDGRRVKSVEGEVTTVYIGDYYEEEYYEEAGPNLISNPGFETSGSWTEFTISDFPGTSFYRSTWGTADEHSGSYAYAISNHAYGYLESDPINVKAGVAYVLSAYVRGEIDPDDGHGKWSLRAYLYDSQDAYLGYVQAASGSPGSLSTTWQQQGGSPFYFFTDAKYMRIRLYNYMNSGWVAFDDVSLNYWPQGGSNLISNPGFESAGGWTENTVSGFPATSFFRSTWGTADEHSGSYAYVISNHAYGHLESDPISVAGNTAYDLHAWVRGELDVDDSHGYWTIRAYFYDGQGGSLGFQTAASGGPGTLSTAWQQKGGSITTPAGTDTLVIWLFNYMNSGWVTFDDVSLTTGGGPNLVVNPGFETAGGWAEEAYQKFPGTSMYRSTWGTASEHSGSYGYVISNHAYGNLRSEHISVAENTDFEISAYLRGEIDADDSFGKWILRAYYYDDQGGSLGYQNAASGGAGTIDTSWQYITGTVTTPADTATLRVFLYDYMHTGWVAYDDVALNQISGLEMSVTARKYYYAGAQRVAVRENDTLFWLLSDHLGSTSVTVDEAGENVVGEMRYEAWGEDRHSTGTVHTERHFTGQIEEADLGLYFYNARWYDPRIIQFNQPDTIIPDPYNPADWNRFAYARYNPVRYTDPSGHAVECGYAQEICEDETPLEPITEFPDYNYRDSAMTTLGLITNWFLELGPDTYVFSSDHSLTMDIMASSGMEEFREIWAAEGYPVPYTWEHQIDNREEGFSGSNIGIFIQGHAINPLLAHLGLGSRTAEGQVDTVGGSIGSLDQIVVEQWDDNNVVIAVHNEMGWASGTRIPGSNRSIGQNRPRSAFGPGGTIWQIFIWIEPRP